MAAPRITAPTLVKLLRARHSKDVFVDECKDGPTLYGSHRRLDAWAMPRSWSKPWIHGYEVKVSRSDFLADEKWPAYLDCCNYFWFVAPPGVIQLDEVPETAGLVVASKNGNRLFTKKKAPLRDAEIRPDVFRYVLMCRAEIRSESDLSRGSVERWRAWLDQKIEKQRVGYEVGARIRKLHEQLRDENERLRESIAGLEDLREHLRTAGIPERRLRREWDRKRLLQEITGDQVVRDAEFAAKSLVDAVDRFRAAIGTAGEQP